MTTNQTIDGVPGLRSLLERVTSQSMGMSAKKDRAEAAHELRALLEAESAPCAKSQVEPASQPRGETVAWHCVGDIGTEHVTLSQDCADAWFSHGGRSLPLVYAEQPAQVAGVLPERSNQDYAIEHAEYMALSADDVLAKFQAYGLALLAVDEGGDDGEGELLENIDSARSNLQESLVELRSMVYEFRKRSAKSR